MSKRTYLIVGLIALVAVSLGVFRLLTPPAGITDFPDNLMDALEDAWEERRSQSNDFGGQMSYVDIWSQQEGLHLVRFVSQRGGGNAILAEEEGEVSVLAMSAWEGRSSSGAISVRRLPTTWGWHVPQLNMMVTGFESDKKFYRAEVIHSVEGEIRKVEYDAPDGATRGMAFIRYEHSRPGSGRVFFYDKDGNLIR